MPMPKTTMHKMIALYFVRTISGLPGSFLEWGE